MMPEELRAMLMQTGMGMMAQSDQPYSTVLGNLGRALPAGVQAGREAGSKARWDHVLAGAPPQMREALRFLGPERGSEYMMEMMTAGAASPVQLSEGAQLVSPTGELIAENVRDPTPEETRRDVRNVGNSLVEVLPDGVQTIYEAPEGGPDFGEVAQLRNRFEANVAPYEQSAQAFRKMEASATGEATPAKDIALIFNYMKAIDPASSVREGEFATAQNAGSAFTVAGNLYNRVLTGQRLNETQRAEFLNSAREQVLSLLPQYQSVADQYRGIAESNGFDTAQVIRNPFAGINLAPTAPAGSGLSDDEIMRRILGR
jgi:hypothetical protein